MSGHDRAGTVLTVLAPGPLTTIQDLGRPGMGTIGVPTGGAADRSALRHANRLLGNPDGAAGLELTLGGLRLRPDGAVHVALTGAPCELRTGGQGAAFGARLLLRAGDELVVGTPVTGLRTYLAVDGGIGARTVLGSAGASPSLGLGPAPLRAGDRLPVAGGATGASTPPGPGDGLGARWQASPEARVVPGPREAWFAPDALTVLTTAAWTATSDLDRIGVRLTGPVLTRAAEREGAELASEPMVRGAIQVPPDGRPVVLLADHPTTGGYPVIAVVSDADTDRLAQLRPGDRVRFRAVSAPWR